MSRRNLTNTSEQAVAELVVAYLERLGADVYQEVGHDYGHPKVHAYPVDTQGVMTWPDLPKHNAKNSTSTPVTTSPNEAYMGLGETSRSRSEQHVVNSTDIESENAAAVTGRTIGVRDGWQPDKHAKVHVRAEARRWNRHPVALAAELKPEHKTHAKAGAIGAGGRWTPFRDTCEQLARLVREQPGLTVKQAVDQIKHHYSTPSTARSSLTAWIADGKVPGVEMRRGLHGPITLYPASQATV